MEKQPRLLVVGFGMIGASLAARLSGNGFAVDVLVRSEGSAHRGLERYRDVFDALVQKGLVTPAQAEASENRVRIIYDYAQAADAEVAFECAAEVIGEKREIYRRVGEACPHIRAIASTSSAFSPELLAEDTGSVFDRVMVAHPMNPPHAVPLMELCAHTQTRADAVEAVRSVLSACGHNCVELKKSVPGFLLNRLQHALLREAIYMVQEGYADFREIDDVLQYGLMPRYTAVGLFEHQDAAGLELVCNIDTYLFPALCADKAVSPVVTERIAEGKLGMKSGEGFYRWDEEGKKSFARRTVEPYLKNFNWPGLQNEKESK